MRQNSARPLNTWTTLSKLSSLRQTPPSSGAKPGCCLPFSWHLEDPPPKESPTPAEPPTTLPPPHLYPCPRRCVVPLPADWFRESWPMGSKGKSVGMLGGSRSSQNGRQRGESSLLASECHCGSLTSLQPFGDCEEGMGQGAKEGAHKEGTMAWGIPGLPSWNSPNLEHWGFCQMNVFIV